MSSIYSSCFYMYNELFIVGSEIFPFFVLFIIVMIKKSFPGLQVKTLIISSFSVMAIPDTYINDMQYRYLKLLNNGYSMKSLP